MHIQTHIHTLCKSTFCIGNYTLHFPQAHTNTLHLHRLHFAQAIEYLHKNGLKQIGHVQSGNIFIEGDTCLLGGYENALLGYRSRLHQVCENHLSSIDTIMFGEHITIAIANNKSLSYIH